MDIQKLGVVDHAEADSLMRRLQQRRLDGDIEDTILFLEHPEVVTVGPRARKEKLQIPSDFKQVDVDRGGGLTWHGPGQVVVYPIILWLQDDERNVSQIIHKLEGWVISALARLGIEGSRDERMRGVWVDGHKVASIGLSFLRWVSRHGFTINLDTPAGRVERLSGCGLEADLTTSLARLGHNVDSQHMITALGSTVASSLNRNND